MAGYKETPRQKMIAMMYLVLTALLALNVSVEILQAFLIVNKSIETSNQSFAGKIDQTFSEFEKQYNMNQDKVKPFWDKAQNAKRYSEELVKYLEDTKFEIVAISERMAKKPEEVKQKFYKVDYRPNPDKPNDSIQVLMLQLEKVPSRDKWDEPTHYFIGDSQDGSRGKARELKNKLAEYKKNMLNLIDPKAREHFKMGIDLEGPFYDADGKSQSFEMHHFYHTILAADITILNKLITEVHSTEFDVTNQLYASITKEDFKFDKINAKVVPESGLLFQGEEYKAEVFVAAYDTKTAPEVYVVDGADTVTDAMMGNARKITGENGLVNLRFPTGNTGVKKYAGVILVKSPAGLTNKYYFHDEYTVMKPALTVSATKMNKFYIGVDNPVSISVPGVPVDKIKPSISVGTLTRAGENWIVRIPTTANNQDVVISVSAGDGTRMKSMGSVAFKGKRVPDPVPFVGATANGPINKSQLLASAVIPKMPADFDFDLNFVITSFTFVTTGSGGDVYQKNVSGNIFPEDIKKVINAARIGQKIWIENISAKGQDGTTRRLATVSLQIK